MHSKMHKPANASAKTADGMHTHQIAYRTLNLFNITRESDEVGFMTPNVKMCGARSASERMKGWALSSR